MISQIQKLETLFPLGEIRLTQGANEVLEFFPDGILSLLKRHASGDWGDLGIEDKRANDRALKRQMGERIFSVYQVGNKRLWVVTEGDRSATTVLLPGEY